MLTSDESLNKDSNIINLEEDSTPQENTMEFRKYQFGDTEFVVPSRYIELSERGMGAQGAVWWVFMCRAVLVKGGWVN